MHKIVIVGGGAGGLELATRLGKTYRRNKDVSVTLVICIGSLSNDFGTQGVKEYAWID